MSIALKNNRGNFLPKEMLESVWKKELWKKKWGQGEEVGFVTGIITALVFILPVSILFIYAMISGPWNHPNSDSSISPVATIRDFSATPDTSPKDYLSIRATD